MTKHQLGKYISYKESGIDLIQEIPEHWSIQRVKNVVSKIGNGVTPRGGSEVYQEEGIPFLRSQNVHDEGLKLSNVSFISPAIHDEMKNSQLKAGDILFNITGASIGRTCLIPKELEEANISQHVVFLRVKEPFNKEYISLFLKSNFVKSYIRFEQSGASKEAFTLNQISTIPLVLPKPQEQQVIADYLDAKTTQIDRKIELLEQKAEKYTDLKQSLINETVTRGLDKTVPMKDSGVEWIGQIPAHWEVKQLKQFATMKGRIGWQGLKNSEFTDEVNSPFLITGMNFKDGKIRWNEVYHISNERYEQAPEIQLKNNDILMTKDGTIGKLLFIDNIPFPHKASLNSHLLVIRPIKKSYFPKFMFHQLNSLPFKHYTELAKSGTTFFGISQEATERYIAVLPPMEEQKAIAEYLDTKTAHIEQIIENINLQIENFKKLRKTLINDVVTGKIKVYEG